MLKLKVSGVVYDMPLMQCFLPVRTATEIRPVVFSPDLRGKKYRWGGGGTQKKKKKKFKGWGL